MAKYNPVYLLDLCVLAYQMHSQALIWPLDPYGEQVDEFGKELPQKKSSLLGSKKNDLRKVFLKSVRDNYKAENQSLGYAKFRGPADLFNAPLTLNAQLDTIIQDYSRINPFKLGFTRQNRNKEGVILYGTPDWITDRVKEVWMISKEPFQASKPSDDTSATFNTVAQKIDLGPQVKDTARDYILCFEGALGKRPTQENATDSTTTAGSWGMMGYVLARQVDHNPEKYDIFVVYRGTRSGKDARQEKALDYGAGHPGWVTNFSLNDAIGGPRQVIKGMTQYQSVAGSPIDKVEMKIHNGYAIATESTLPAIFHAFEWIKANVLNGYAPENIYATAHSLGGALAGCFATAVRFSDTWAPEKANSKTASFEYWAWDRLEVPVFSSAYFLHKDLRLQFNSAVNRSSNIYVDEDELRRGFKGIFTSFAKNKVDLVDYTGDSVNNKLEKFYSQKDVASHSPKHVRASLVKKQKDLAFKERYHLDAEIHPWEEISNKSIEKDIAEVFEGASSSLPPMDIDSLSIFLKSLQTAVFRKDTQRQNLGAAIPIKLKALVPTLVDQTKSKTWQQTYQSVRENDAFVSTMAALFPVKDDDPLKTVLSDKMLKFLAAWIALICMNKNASAGGGQSGAGATQTSSGAPKK